MVSKKSAAESVRSWGSFGLSFGSHNWSHRMERSDIYIYNYINTVYDRCIYATLIQCKDNMPSSVGMYQDQLSTRCAVQDLQIVVSLHFLGQFLHYIKLVPQAGDLFFQHPSTITGA